LPSFRHKLARAKQKNINDFSDTLAFSGITTRPGGLAGEPFRFIAMG
jgi:hypothetical protein